MQTFLEQSVETLTIGTKELKALDLLQVRTIGEFLQVDLQNIYDLRGYGATTYHNLRKVKLELQKTLSGKSGPGWLAQHNTDNNNVSFPEAMKHLSGRAKRALSLLNVKSFNALSQITEEQILNTETLGRGTWREIKTLQHKYAFVEDDQNIDWLNSPVTEAALIRLPFFSNCQVTISDVELHPSYLPYLKLQDTKLPDWSLFYLQQVPLTTLGELLLYPGEMLIQLPGFGNTKLNELRKCVHTFFAIHFKYGEYYRQAATREYLHHFPFFSGIFQKYIQPDDIHESYCPDVRLEHLALPVRALPIFALKNVNTIAQLLLSTPDTFMDIQNFGAISLKGARKAIEQYLFNPQSSDKIVDEATSSFDLIKRFLISVLKPRQYEVIASRYGIVGHQPETLDQIAEKLNLTRERIRQIQLKAEKEIQSPRHLILLQKVKSAMESTIARSGGVISIKHLGSKINKHFSWSDIDTHATSFLAGLFETIELNNGVAFLKDFDCSYCNMPERVILDQLVANKVLDIRVIANHIFERCKHQECEVIKRHLFDLSPEFVKHRIDTKDILQTFICNDGKVFDKKYYGLKYGPKYAVIEHILLEGNNPLHFTDIASVYRKHRPEDGISDQAILGILRNHENAILWDRGTFIHKTFVAVDPEFTERVVGWINQQLQENIDFISVAAVFNRFSEECKGLGVISETALFSYLRIMNPLTIHLNKYPLITKDNRSISVGDFVERYVLNNDGEVPEQNLENLLQRYGFRGSVGSILSNIPNLLVTDRNTILHVDELSMNIKSFHEICKYAAEYLSKTNIVTTHKLFKDKMISCKLLGITGPRLLHSCLRNFGYEYVSTGRGMLLKSTRTENHKKLSFRNELETFIKENAPCSKDRLLERFSEDMGYSEKTIDTITYYSEDIIKYASSCYIHMDSLGDDVHKNTLLNLMKSTYNDSRLNGKLWARLRDILDFKYDSLPKIHPDIPWTFTLLQSLAEKCENINFLGNAKDAYVDVSNNESLQELDELICILLLKQYNGAVSKDVLEQYLTKEGVIRRRLTKNTFNCSTKIVLKGNYVIAKELLANVQ